MLKISPLYLRLPRKKKFKEPQTCKRKFIEQAKQKYTWKQISGVGAQGAALSVGKGSF